MDHIRITADQECIGHLTNAIAHIDKLLSNKLLNPGIKALFRLNGISDADFAGVIQDPLGAVQVQNWDENVGSGIWADFCAVLGSGKAIKSRSEIIRKRAAVLNYAKWIRRVRLCARGGFSHVESLEHLVQQEVVKDCAGKAEECFGTEDDTKFQDTDLSSTWRAWTWQVGHCSNDRNTSDVYRCRPRSAMNGAILLVHPRNLNIPPLYRGG